QGWRRSPMYRSRRSTKPISTAEATLRARGEPVPHRSRSESEVCGPPSGRLRAGRCHRVGHRSAEADVQPIPAVDCEDRERERDDLLRCEAARELVEQLIRCARVGQPRETLAPGERRALRPSKAFRLAPDRDHVEALIGLTVLTRLRSVK